MTLPILTLAQLQGYACVRCGDESTPMQPVGAWGDQSPLVFECIPSLDCRARALGRARPRRPWSNEQAALAAAEAAKIAADQPSA